MANSTTYSFLNVVGSLDGLQIIGGWDGDDAIAITPGVDVGTMLVGADGSSIFSQSANKSATISVKLQHTSPTHRQLTQKLLQQRAGVIRGFPFSIIDTQTKEGGATDQAFIQASPAQGFGVNAAMREWTIVTGNWEPSVPNVVA